MKKNAVCMFQYTSDSANMALEEIKLQLEAVGCTVVNIDIYEECRACRNAYGKEMDNEDFDSIDLESDEAWFDDYDFVIEAEFFHKDISDEEVLFDLVNANVDNFLGTKEEYIEEYELDE